MSESKFNARSTALEVIDGHNLKGYEVIVTGGASGIGVETVKALAKAGARVVVAVRNVTRAEPIIQVIKNEAGNNQIEVEQLDLASLANVRNFVKRFLDKKRPLNILINNAGISYKLKKDYLIKNTKKLRLLISFLLKVSWGALKNIRKITLKYSLQLITSDTLH